MSNIQKSDLVSGEYYSLKQILSDNKKIVVPDLQRDYCWGNKTHGKDHKTELVTGFLDSLMLSFEEFCANKEQSGLTLGMIYAYENPKDFINLCDGQQRFTTLFLLLGMLNKDISNHIQDRLVSVEEMQDDCEPYLRYAVRENTLFFMMDLVKEFFLTPENAAKNNQKISDFIKEQDWYHQDHNLDASVQSILLALDAIQKHEAFKKCDKALFSLFLLENVNILYYDMKNRELGEEMFVIINTTGEPLTVTENIKPILLSQVSGSEDVKNEFNKKWEDREDYFWENKKSNEHSSDNGVNDFLTWFIQIEHRQNKQSLSLLKNIQAFQSFDATKISSNNNLEKIEKLYKSLLNLIQYLQETDFQNIFKAVNDNKEIKNISDIRGLKDDAINIMLLPLLKFIEKFGNYEDSYIFLRRLRKNHFDYVRPDRKVNYVNWRYILQVIEKSNSLNEILSFYKFNDLESNNVSNEQEQIKLDSHIWYNSEEQVKEKLKQIDKQKIEEWEDFDDFQGYLMPLIDMCNSENIIVNIENLGSYFNIYVKLNKKSNTEIYNYYNLLNIFYSYHNWESWEWYIDKNYFPFQTKDLYILLKDTRKITQDIDIINTIKSIIRCLISKIYNDDYSFDISDYTNEKEIKIDNSINDQENFYKNTRYLLLLLQTIDDCNKNNIMQTNICDTINFEEFIKDDKYQWRFGNFLVWHRGWNCRYTPNEKYEIRKQHFTTNNRMTNKNFSFYKDVLEKNLIWGSSEIDKNEKHYINILNSF